MKEIYENWKELNDMGICNKTIAEIEVGLVLIEKRTKKKCIIDNKTKNTISIWGTKTTKEGVNCAQWTQLDGRFGAVANFFKSDEVIEDISAWKNDKIRKVTQKYRK